MVVKRVYVQTMHAVRSGLQRVGALGLLDRYLHHRPVHYIRSQFAIYDVEDLAHLDSPWWSYGAIDAVDAWLSDRENVRAFEWGSGASTLWLEKRVDQLVSIEHDLDFAHQVEQLVNERTEVVPVEAVRSNQPRIGSLRAGHENLDFEDYVHAIDSHAGSFDLICIDGRARVECLEVAIPRLAPKGIIVFDNSERKRYRSGIEQPGLAVETFRGLAPALPTLSSTSIIRTLQES